jgi:hypothetical protein
MGLRPFALPSRCPKPSPDRSLCVRCVRVHQLGFSLRNELSTRWRSRPLFGVPGLSGRCWLFLLKMLQSSTQTYEGGVSL